MSTIEKKDISHDWPEATQFRRSIRFEFSLYMCGIILMLMILTGYFITDKYVNTITQNVIEKLLVQARSYSGSSGKLIISGAGPDELLLNNICKKMAADNPDVYWIGIADNENTFLAHTDIKRVVAENKLIPVTSGKEFSSIQKDEKFDIRNDTIYAMVPIKENEVTVGHLGLAASTREITTARKNSIIAIVSITVLMIILGIPLTVSVLNRKLRPIKLISDSLRQMDFNDIRLDIPLKSKNEFGYLAETFRIMGVRLNDARKDMLEQERISRELEIAREIQANILPRKYPKEHTFEFYGDYRSAREVGGDYYDFIDFDGKYIAFLVADVSGKSLPGMLVMLLTRDIIRQLSRTMHQPAELLMHVNKELLENIKKGMFVTMFIGLLDKETGLFTFASAGHNPLVRITGQTGQIDLLKTKGFPLGMVPPEQFEKRIESKQLNLEPGDWLVQYTDGINEAINSEGNEFGMDRFEESVKSYRNQDPAGLVKGIIDDHKLFVGDAEQFDDITLLALKWNGVFADKGGIGKEAGIGAN